MLKTIILNKFKSIIPFITYQNINNETILTCSKKYLLFNFTMLKKQISYQYSLLSCISGVDLIEKTYRFCIVYDLLSVTYNTRIRIKIFVKNIPILESIFSVFTNSDWWEREVWDLYGIYFVKHPDLRRILTDYGFEGYPLRKDFPLSGYIELRYDPMLKRILAEPLELTQEFRNFEFQMPW